MVSEGVSSWGWWNDRKKKGGDFLRPLCFFLLSSSTSLFEIQYLFFPLPQLFFFWKKKLSDQVPFCFLCVSNPPPFIAFFFEVVCVLATFDSFRRVGFCEWHWRRAIKGRNGIFLLKKNHPFPVWKFSDDRVNTKRKGVLSINCFFCSYLLRRRELVICRVSKSFVLYLVDLGFYSYLDKAFGAVGKSCHCREDQKTENFKNNDRSRLRHSTKSDHYFAYCYTNGDASRDLV